jgi:HK97 family phage prohead protease
MSQIEIRSADADHWELSGNATTYGTAYLVVDYRGEYREQIAPGAFADAAAGRDRVALYVQHNHSVAPLASTPASLRFSDTASGLVMGAVLPKAERDVADAVAKVQRGVLTGLSIGMHVRRDAWSADRTQRTINDAKLGEVSLVHAPANPHALATVRAELGDDVELRWVGSLGVVEARRDFTDREKAALGKRGLALWIDGHWAFPTPTRSDFDNAVQSIGRTPGRNRATVRRYLMKRARAEGWPIPPSWGSDGSIKSGSRSSATSLGELQLRAAFARADVQEAQWSQLTRQYQGPTDRGWLAQCARRVDEALGRRDAPAAARAVREEAVALRAEEMGL